MTGALFDIKCRRPVVQQRILAFIVYFSECLNHNYIN